MVTRPLPHIHFGGSEYVCSACITKHDMVSEIILI